MRDILLDNTGDVIINNNDVQLVSGKELTMQKVKLVLSTNKGEWLLNEQEGINFKVMLVKKHNEDEVMDTIRDGLRQIDETFVIEEYKIQTINRKLIVEFKAVNEDGEELRLAVGEGQATTESGEVRDILICGLSADEILRSGSALDALCICVEDETVFVGDI